MAQGTENNQEPEAALSERVEQYRREIQSLIKQGVESSRFEFKRSCSISRDNLDDRLDFIRFLQGVANAEVSGERCITIGADPKEKRFYPVSNTAEFDPATVASVVAKYLDPVPRFQVFNNLLTDGQEPFVLIVLDESQPRPIAIKTEGQKLDGRNRLQVGEIWIKKGTALQPASRSDIDLMYKQRMEEEAEDRARKRFKHFGELSGPSHMFGPSPTRLPVRELLVGPTPEFRRFTEELIAANDYPRFCMLLELARESLVDGWDNLGTRGPGLPSNPKEYVSQVNGFFRDEFGPSLQSVVVLGLLVVKYDFEINWLQSVVDMLLETFDASRGSAAFEGWEFDQ